MLNFNTAMIFSNLFLWTLLVSLVLVWVRKVYKPVIILRDMDKDTAFQDRFLLNLDSDPTSKLLRSMLKSPLGLANEVISCLFNNEFDEIKNKLDGIKEFVAGVKRAENLGSGYILAKFYPSLFAFHQYFHSSYRARQGKTLEESIKEVLRETNPSLEVPDKLSEKMRILASIFRGYNSKGDIDVVAKNQDKVMAIQLRSRDDTGGTTAKSSLVEVLRRVLSLKKIQNIKFFYHVCVWEEIESNQKNITKSKIYESLEHQLTPLRITKQKFLVNIEKGIFVKRGIFLKLSYGTIEILKTIKGWLGNPSNLKNSAIKDMIRRMESWDDLWLSYAIASVEIETQKIRGHNNIGYLNGLLKNLKYDTDKFSKNEEFVSLANDLALKIIPLWQWHSIPLDSPSDKVHYIRDLILLKFVNDLL